MNATITTQNPNTGVPTGYYRDQRGNLKKQSASTPVQRAHLTHLNAREGR